VKVDNQVGFILHTTPYKESSLLVDLFTLQYGRIRCVAKGYRKPSKTGATRALFPYTEYQLGWLGRGDLKTLIQSEAIGASLFLQGSKLFTGLYVNELFYRLLHEYDPYETLFTQYQYFLQKLAAGTSRENDLRQLEMCLLDELGYGLALDADAIHGLPLIADKLYNYIPEQGLIECSNQKNRISGVYAGIDLIAFARGDSISQSVSKTAKHLLRSVINFYLNGKPLHSRALYRDYLSSNSEVSEGVNMESSS
jgi:DNA repair protein RecO (recombination protein O)